MFALRFLSLSEVAHVLGSDDVNTVIFTSVIRMSLVRNGGFKTLLMQQNGGR